MRTAAARCMGPVSPVMKIDSRSSTAASTTRSMSGGSSVKGTSVGQAARIASTAGLSFVDPITTTVAPRVRASSAPTSANRPGSHSLMRLPAAG